MKLYELIIDDEEMDEVFAVSLVENPAIESDFVYFDKEKLQFEKVNDEERLVMGPILIPNKKILRMDGMGMPYEVYFKPETVKKLSQMYLQKKYNDKATIEHEEKVLGVSLVESWIVESAEKDKSKLYGLNLPTGTWAGTFKINNDEIWNEWVKTGKVRGFSIEGLFSQRLEKDEPILDLFAEELEEEQAGEYLNSIRSIILGEEIHLQSYTDYPQSVKNNAKRGIELNERQENKCATQTGKIRAQQLANGEPISLETIKRMHGYLSRAETYYDENNTTECGTISYLLWGGKSALSWSKSKLEELGELQQPTVDSTYPGERASGSISPSLLQGEELDVFGYETQYFYICPGAIGTFTDLISQNIEEEERGMVRSAALIADKIFEIEAKVVNSQNATPKQLSEVKILVDDFKDLMREIGEEIDKEYDVSYMDGHIEVVESYL